MKKFMIFTILALTTIYAYNQEKNNLNLSIFIDGNVDQDYIKENLKYVNYVRDVKEADVYVLFVREVLGGGGRAYKLYLQGQKKYTGTNDTLIFNSKADATDEERREGYFKILKLGLVPYILKSGNYEHLSISSTKDNAETEDEVKDKWNNWVFGLSANTYMNGEKSYKFLNSYNYAKISRVTEVLRFELRYTNIFEKTLYTYEVDSVPIEIESIVKNQRIDHDMVFSINNHWSYGYRMQAKQDSYSNMDLSIEILPSVEYNLFPYSESSTKQLRLLYGIGPKYFDYTDTTLYDKTKELLWYHNLSIGFETVQKWGNISLSVEASNYLNNFSYNRLSAYTSIDWRITKGLSFNIWGQFNLKHDQLYLKKEGASPEEILTRQQELQSTYQFYTMAGISYTFCSIYNNIVNPRFGY